MQLPFYRAVLMKIIHIGLPKTGSTSLQAQWCKRSDINYVQDGLHEFVKETGKVILAGGNHNPLIDLWPQPSAQQPLTIYSSEGLAGLSWGTKATSEHYEYGHYLFANLCKANVPDAKVLVFIRSPESWLRSVYLQMIQEGQTFGFARFFRDQRNYLYSALNLKAMLGHWERAFGEENVVYYPLERLVASPAQANKELSAELNIPANMHLFELTQKVNTSLNSDSIQLLRAVSILNKRIQGRQGLLRLSFKKLDEQMRLLYRAELQREPKKFNFIKQQLSPISYALPTAEKLGFNNLISNYFLDGIKVRGDKFHVCEDYSVRLERYLDGKPQNSLTAA